MVNNDYRDLFVPLTGTLADHPIKDNVVLNNTSIINIRDPINTNDLVNLKTLQKDQVSLIPLTGNSLANPITGSLIFNNVSTISHIVNPKNNSDIINLVSLNTEASKYLAKTGGTLTGNINADNRNITGIKNSSNPTDAASLNNITTGSDYNNYLQLQGNTTQTPITGNLVFNNTSSIYGLENPSELTDAVNLSTLHTKSLSYLSQSGGIVTGDIDANNNTVTNIADPINSGDAANLRYLNSQTSLYLHTNKTESLSGSLNMNNNKVLSLESPSDPQDGVPLGFLDNYLNGKLSEYIPLSGTAKDTFITGDLNFNGTGTITQFLSPVNSQDAVNLLTLSNKANQYLSLTGGTMTGNIVMNSHSVINVPQPTKPKDLVNINTCINSNNTFKDNYIPLSGNSLEKPITGNFVFNKTTTITGLATPISSNDAINFETLTTKTGQYLPLTGGSLQGNITLTDSGKVTQGAAPSNPQDAVNLQTLTTKTGQYLPLTGGSLSGNINLIDSGLITQVANPVNPQDAVTLQTLNNTTTDTNNTYIPLKGTLTGYPIKGNLVFDGTHTVTGLANPTLNADIVNFQTLNTEANKYFLLDGSEPLQGPLNLSNNPIVNLAPSSTPTDAVNFSEISTNTSNYLALSGGTMSGNITCDNNSVIGLPIPSADNDAINLSYFTTTLNTFINNKYIPLTRTLLNFPITGNLVFNSKATLTNLKDPSGNTDIVNLQSLNSKANQYLALSGGTMSGNIDANSQSVTSSFSPVDPQDALSLQALNQLLSTSFRDYVLLSGTTPGNPITGDLAFNAKATLTNLKDPSGNTDIVNLQSLTAKANQYLALSGGTMTGNIDANSQSVTSSFSPVDPQDAVTLNILNSIISTYNNYLPISGTTPSQPITGELVFNNCLFTGIANPTNNSDAVNLQTLNQEANKYLPLSGGNMLGPIDLSNNLISNIADSTEANDAVNLQTLISYGEKLKTEYVPLSGNSVTSLISGNIDLNNKLTITGLSDPIQETDAVNLQYLNKEADKYLSLSGGTMTGNITLSNQKLIITSNTTTPTSAINLDSFNNLLSQYIPKSGTTDGKPITGDIFFNNSASITGLATAKQNSDIVNLETLQTKAKTYLPLTGGTMIGNIDMGGNKIINVPIPTSIDSTALVPMSLFSPYLLKKRNSEPISLDWNLNEITKWNATPPSLNISSSNANSYFSFGNNDTHLSILKTGSYYISITASITTPENTTPIILGIILNNSTNNSILAQTTTYSSLEMNWGTSFAIKSINTTSPAYLSLLNYSANVSLNSLSWFITRLANI